MEVIPAPSVGQTVELEGKEYEVMAVVLPSNPVVSGASDRGSPEESIRTSFFRRISFRNDGRTIP